MMARPMSREEFQAEFNDTIASAFEIIDELSEHEDLFTMLAFSKHRERTELYARCMCIIARAINTPIHTLFSALEIVYWRQTESVRADIREKLIEVLRQWIYHHTLACSTMYKYKPLGGWQYTYDPWESRLVADGRDVPFHE